MEVLLLTLLLIGLAAMAITITYAWFKSDLPAFGDMTPILGRFIPLAQPLKRLLRSKCPYCKDPFSETDSLVNCSRCKAKYHKECAKIAAKCSVFGCSTELISSRMN